MTAAGDAALASLRSAISSVRDLVAGVAADQWTASTPCEDMNVLQLVEHLAGVMHQFGEVGAGNPVDFEDVQSFEPDGALAGFDAAAELMLSAWSEPGRTDLSYPMPWGETPGDSLVGFTLIETLAHGWDLAQATGRHLVVDDSLARSALERARRYDDPSIRVPGMFGPALPCPPDADPIDQLAAFLGRPI